MTWVRWTALILRVGERNPVLGGLLAALTFVVPFGVIGAFVVSSWGLWIALTGGMLLIVWIGATFNATRSKHVAAPERD